MSLLARENRAWAGNKSAFVFLDNRQEERVVVTDWTTTAG